MTDTELWTLWAVGTLHGIGARADGINGRTVWNWTHAESPVGSFMRWCNPLNSTEKWPGSKDSLAQPGPHDVQIYLTVLDGINATVATLLNGLYPDIVRNLQASRPYSEWGQFSAAGAQLHAWGTGTAWLLSYYGGSPMDFTQSFILGQVRMALSTFQGPDHNLPNDPATDGIVTTLASQISPDGSNFDTVMRSFHADPNSQPWIQAAANLRAGKYLMTDPDVPGVGVHKHHNDGADPASALTSDPV